MRIPGCAASSPPPVPGRWSRSTLTRRSSPSWARKWAKELDYALRKELRTFTDDRIAVRFQYEWHDTDGQWRRSYGNALWEFDAGGLMRRREAGINDLAITAALRRIFGPVRTANRACPSRSPSVKVRTPVTCRHARVL